MSEEQDDSQKTEEPTPKKLKEARDKGQVAQSREVNHVLMILGGAIIIMLVTPLMTQSLVRDMGLFIERSHDFRITNAGFSTFMYDSLLAIGGALALAFIVLLFFGFMTGVIQNGLIFSPDSMKPKLERISPIKGFKRLFSLKSVVEFLKGIAKLCIVAVIGVLLMTPMLDSLHAYVTLEVGDLIDVTKALAMKLLFGVLAVLVLIAGLDWLYQKFEFTKSMRMTKQEMKDEFKQTEGDPLIKSKLRQIRQERARQRMMAAVPEADVVITNPTHYAIALQYDMEKMIAPTCVAKGIDGVALRIREVAEENNVPVVENPPLARALHESMDIEDTIPNEHFKAVAEIISFIFKQKGKM